MGTTILQRYGKSIFLWHHIKQKKGEMMRILLLRTLIAWWMIPATWILVWFIAYLFFGYKETIEGCRSLTKMLWYGE